jgi:hypothetical protein
METFFLELLILKKEGRLHFPLSAIVFEILISQKLQFDPQQNRTTGGGVMASEMSVFTYSCIFGYYLEIYRR